MKEDPTLEDDIDQIRITVQKRKVILEGLVDSKDEKRNMVERTQELTSYKVVDRLQVAEPVSSLK